VKYKLTLERKIL